MKMSPVMRWFLANIGFHHIHHLNSRIPFYRLPEVYRTMPELQHVTTTSLLPPDIVRCLRLKVWDPDRAAHDHPARAVQEGRLKRLRPSLPPP